MKNIYDEKVFFDEYAKMLRSQKGLDGAGEWQQFQEMLPDFHHKTVLDLGCGYGWHSYYCASHGALSVLGIDLSQKMIDKARQINHHHNVCYEVCDLLKYAYPSYSYDCVISNLVLHYIEDLNDIYQKVYQTLKEDGVFVFNIEHPTFTAGVNQMWIEDENHQPLYWPVDDYFLTGKRETMFLNQTVIKYHHTLTDILQGLLKTGFVIEDVQEVIVPSSWLHMEGMKDELRRPMMLLVKARKKQEL